MTEGLMPITQTARSPATLSITSMKASRPDLEARERLVDNGTKNTMILVRNHGTLEPGRHRR
jgi:hypothetical protein